MSGPRVVLLIGCILVPPAITVQCAAVAHAFHMPIWYVWAPALLYGIAGWLGRDSFVCDEAEYSRRRAASILPWVRGRY